MWTVANQTASPIEVQDVPDPQTIAAFGTAEFAMSDFLTSATLASQVGSGALCVVGMGDFAPLARIAPVSYPVLPATALTQSGKSTPVTLAPYQSGTLFAACSALSQGGSVAISFSEWDGGNDYPPVSVATISAAGNTAVPFFPSGAPIAGFFTWTLVGTATLALVYQVR